MVTDRNNVTILGRNIWKDRLYF